MHMGLLLVGACRGLRLMHKGLLLPCTAVCCVLLYTAVSDGVPAGRQSN